MSLITPESEHYLQLYMQSRLFKEMGIPPQRSMAEMPARMVDAFTRLEAERLKVEVMRYQATRDKNARDPD